MQFSSHLGISPGPLDDWFDPDLSVDTRLFLDPFLLLGEGTNPKSMWADAHGTLIAHFARCFELLAKGTGPGSQSEKIVHGLLSFPEPAEMCLGYTGSGTAGSGSGSQQAKLIVGSIVTALRAGLQHPQHIEEIGILNEGIGADRISDAACNVLKPLAIAYTKQVASRHSLPTQPIRVRHAMCNLKSGRWIDEEHDLPENPFTGRAVLLLPKRFLNRLPTLNADDWFDSTFNADLRRDLNVEVGEKVRKADIVKAARRHPERIRYWADEIRAAGGARCYDYSRDPLGIVSWQKAGENFASRNPIAGVPAVSSPSELRTFVGHMLDHFKLFIEDQGGWKLLWNDDGTEKPEEAAQLALLGMARPYCRAHGVEVDREVDFGRGPVDFKITAGTHVRLLVEVKKLHSGGFWNGLEAQLPSYMKSDQTGDGWLLAIQLRSGGISKSRPNSVRKRLRGINADLGTTIEFANVDARPKQSASKLKRQR